MSQQLAKQAAAYLSQFGINVAAVDKVTKNAVSVMVDSSYHSTKQAFANAGRAMRGGCGVTKGIRGRTVSIANKKGEQVGVVRIETDIRKPRGERQVRVTMAAA